MMHVATFCFKKSRKQSRCFFSATASQLLGNNTNAMVLFWRIVQFLTILATNILISADFITWRIQSFTQFFERRIGCARSRSYYCWKRRWFQEFPRWFVDQSYVLRKRYWELHTKRNLPNFQIWFCQNGIRNSILFSSSEIKKLRYRSID